MARFIDRRDAGRRLGEQLAGRADRGELVVVGLPRGGVPVAYEVAHALDAPLDVLAVRKLGVPGREELAMGAIASGGVLVLNDDVIARARIEPGRLEAIAERARGELARGELMYRGGRSTVEVSGCVALAVDDGLATGATMRAAVAALRRRGAERVVVAVPVAAAATRDELARHADELLCAQTPEPFVAVGAWYEDFRPVSDREVRALLARASRP